MNDKARLRFWTALMLGWLLAFYNVERIHEPINLASFVYVMAAIAGIFAIAAPRLHQLPSFYCVGLLVIVLLVTKQAMGYAITGAALPLTLTEFFAIYLTFWLAGRISRCIAELEDEAADVATLHLEGKAGPFTLGQGEMYREVRRARDFERPLALAAIRPTAASVQREAKRFLQEMHEDILHRYVEARLADFLVHQTKDSDLVSQDKDHFLVLLPERDQQQTEEFIERVQANANESLGLELAVGVATFPDKEVTLSGLLDRAMGALNEQTRNYAAAAMGNSSWRPAEKTAVATIRLDERSAPDAAASRVG